MNLELTIRFDYGSVVPWVHRIERRDSCDRRPGHDPVANGCATSSENMRTQAEFTVAEGQKVFFNLTW